MSVSEIKKQQNYRRNLDMCGNCKHYTSDVRVDIGVFGDRTVESRRRCGLGGFAVFKTAVCDKYER